MNCRRRSALRLGHLLGLVWGFVGLVGCVAGFAQAQQVDIYNDVRVDLQGGTGAEYRLEPTITLSEIPFGTALFGLRFATNTDRLVEFGVRLGGVDPAGRGSSELYSLSFDTDFKALFQAEVAARVAVENLAIGVSVAAFNANPGEFDARERFVEEARPSYSEATLTDRFVTSLGVEVDYVAPQVAASFAPTIFWIPDVGLGGRLLADIGVPGTLRGNSLLLLRAERQLSDPDDPDSDSDYGGEYGAVGFGYETGGDGWLLLRTSVWLGTGGGERLAPGGRLELSSPESGERIGYRFSVAAEPYRTDVVPYRATADLSLPAGPGAFTFGLYSDFGSDQTVFRSGYGFGF